MECNPTEFLEERKYIYNTKESSVTAQWTFHLSLASEGQCQLLTLIVIFWQSKILKLRIDCEYIPSKIKYDVADLYLQMS